MVTHPGPAWTTVLRDRVEAGGTPLIGVVAGSGMVAAAAVAAGAELLLVLNAGRFRHLGVGSLAGFMPYGNANRDTLRLLEEEVLPRRGTLPVVAGICGHDPELDLGALLARYRELGVDGVVNWPAVGFVDGKLRAAMEDAGCGEASELATLRAARAAGLSAVGFVLEAAAAVRYAAAGCDALVLDLGLTQALDDARERRDRVRAAAAGLNRMARAVRSAGHHPLCLGFGGPVTEAPDVGELLRFGFVHGFAGGSVFERLPVRDAVAATVRGFQREAARQVRHADAGYEQLVGTSAPMHALYRAIDKVAPTEIAVVLHGETGSGKELAAAAIHRRSRRADAPFVTVNCGAIPDELVESELFGHEKGAFTGAARRRPGKFELAHGGTLFLDEVADLSPRAQVALLRVLQTRELVRVGGDEPLAVDVRVIAASHRHLAEEVAAGRFRADLRYRLDQITLALPPLRERLDDLPALIDHLLPELARQLGRPITGITDDCLAGLRAHSWPGNVRELFHAITRAAVLEEGAVLTGRGVFPLEGAATAPAPDRVSRARAAVAAADGNKSAAAAALGISRRTLYAWLARG